MTKKTKELGSQKAQPVSARAGAAISKNDVAQEPKAGMTKGVQLTDRGHQLMAACDYLEDTLLDMGAIDASPKKDGELGTKASARHTTMDGLCDLQRAAQSIDDAVNVYVNGPDMGEDDDGTDADSDKADKIQSIVEKTDFGRRVLAKSDNIHRLFTLIRSNLYRIESSLLRSEPQAGSQGPTGQDGPRGPIGGGVPELSAIDLILNLEEAAHELEMRIMHVSSRLRETY